MVLWVDPTNSEALAAGVVLGGGGDGDSGGGDADEPDIAAVSVQPETQPAFASGPWFASSWLRQVL